MKYLDGIETHLYKQETLYESLVRFSEETIHTIEKARSLRSAATNKMLDDIFGYEEMSIVDDEGKRIVKKIPRQRIISFAPPKDKKMSDIIEELSPEQKDIYYTAKSLLEIEGYFLFDPINGLAISFREILSYVKKQDAAPMDEFPVIIKTITIPPPKQKLKEIKEKVNKRAKEENWVHKKKQRIYKLLIDRHSKTEQKEIIDVAKVTNKEVMSWMRQHDIENIDFGKIKKVKIYGIFSKMIENVEKSNPYKTPEELEVRKNYYQSLSDNYADTMSSFLNKGVYYMISRSAYDVAAMSTGQSWDSCMTIGRAFHKYILKPGGDISSGTLILYLMNIDKASGKQIKDKEEFDEFKKKSELDDIPFDDGMMGRILIKPFYNIFEPENTDDIVYKCELVAYGPDQYKEQLKEAGARWADVINKDYLKKPEANYYVFHCGRHYDDTRKFQHMLLNSKGEEVDFSEIERHSRNPYIHGGKDTIIRIGDEYYDFEYHYDDPEDDDNWNEEYDDDDDDNYEQFYDYRIEAYIDDLYEAMTTPGEEFDIDVPEILEEWKNYYGEYNDESSNDGDYEDDINIQYRLIHSLYNKPSYYLVDYLFVHYSQYSSDSYSDYLSFYGTEAFENAYNREHKPYVSKEFDMDELLSIMSDLEQNPPAYEEELDGDFAIVTADELTEKMDAYLINEKEFDIPNNIATIYFIGKCLYYNDMKNLSRLYEAFIDNLEKIKISRIPLDFLLHEKIPQELRDKLMDVLSLEMNLVADNIKYNDVFSKKFESLEKGYIQHSDDLFFEYTGRYFYVSMGGIGIKESYNIKNEDDIKRLDVLYQGLKEKYKKQLNNVISEKLLKNYSKNEVNHFFSFYLISVNPKEIHNVLKGCDIVDVMINMLAMEAQLTSHGSLINEQRKKSYQRVYTEISRFINREHKSTVIKKDVDVGIKLALESFSLNDKTKVEIISRLMKSPIEFSARFDFHGYVKHKPHYAGIVKAAAKRITKADLNKAKGNENLQNKFTQIFSYLGNVKYVLRLAKKYVDNNTMRWIIQRYWNEEFGNGNKNIYYKTELYKHIINTKTRAEINKEKNKDIHLVLFQFNGEELNEYEKKKARQMIDFFDDPKVMKKFNFGNAMNFLSYIPMSELRELENKKLFFKLVTSEMESSKIYDNMQLVKRLLGNNEKTNAIIRERAVIKRVDSLKQSFELYKRVDIIYELDNMIKDNNYIEHSILDYIPNSFHILQKMNPLINNELKSYFEKNREELSKLLDIYTEQGIESRFRYLEHYLYLIKENKWKDLTTRSMHILTNKMISMTEFDDIIGQNPLLDDILTNPSGEYNEDWDRYEMLNKNISSLFDQLDKNISKEDMRLVIGTYMEELLNKILAVNSPKQNWIYLNMTLGSCYIWHLHENKDKIINNVMENGIGADIALFGIVKHVGYWKKHKLELGKVLFDLAQITKDSDKKIKLKTEDEKYANIDYSYYYNEYQKAAYEETKAKDDKESPELSSKTIMNSILKKKPAEMVKEMGEVYKPIVISNKKYPSLSFMQKLMSKTVRGMRAVKLTKEEVENISNNVIFSLIQYPTATLIAKCLSKLSKSNMLFLKEIGFIKSIIIHDKFDEDIRIDKRAGPVRNKEIDDRVTNHFFKYMFYDLMKEYYYARPKYFLQIKNYLEFPTSNKESILESVYKTIDDIIEDEKSKNLKDNKYVSILFYTLLFQGEDDFTTKYAAWEYKKHGQNSKYLYMVKEMAVELVAIVHKRGTWIYVGGDIEKSKDVIHNTVSNFMDAAKLKIEILESLDESWRDKIEKITEEEVEKIDIGNWSFK